MLHFISHRISDLVIEFTINLPVRHYNHHLKAYHIIGTSVVRRPATSRTLAMGPGADVHPLKDIIAFPS